MKPAILGLLLILLFAKLYASEQRAVTVWGNSCLHLSQASWAEAPLKDGEPDYAHVLVHGLKIDKACGVIKVERVKEAGK